MKPNVAKLKPAKGRVSPVVCGFLAALGVVMPPAQSFSQMQPQIETPDPGAARRISRAQNDAITGIGKERSEAFAHVADANNGDVHGMHSNRAGAEIGGPVTDKCSLPIQMIIP